MRNYTKNEINHPELSHWIWLFIGLFSFLILFLLLSRLTSFEEEISLKEFVRSLAISFFYMAWALWLNYHLINRLNTTPYLKNKPVARIGTEVICTILLAALFITIGNIPFNYKTGLRDYFFSAPYWSSLIAGILLNSFMVIALEFFYQFRQNRQKETDIEKMKTEYVKMQYKQLKGQINPHFLFNSLNVLISLINKDPGRATEFTKKLSEVYRYVLTQDTSDFISVTEELDFIRIYTQILTIRFGEGLKTETTIQEKDLKRSVLPMSLQVLVENAIKHNVVSVSQPLTITISSDTYYIIVVNNINKRIRAGRSNGIGLKNLAEKYRIISGSSIIIEQTETYFIVKIPLL